MIGSDDWAWKKSQRYGRIIVDLERQCPIALLSERLRRSLPGSSKVQLSPSLPVTARIPVL